MGNRNRKFEDSWKEALNDKEMAPSGNLWSNLDAHLANQEAKKYRKGFFFYKWVAAAAVILAFGLGIYSYVEFGNSMSQLADNSENEGVNIREENNKTEKLSSAEKIMPSSNMRNNDNIASRTAPTNENTLAKHNNEGRPIITGSRQEGSTASSTNSSEGVSDIVAVLANKKNVIPSSGGASDDVMAYMDGRGLVLNVSELRSPDIIINKFVIFSDDPFKNKKDDLRDMWAGIGFSGGQFNPNEEGGTRSDNISQLSENTNFKAAFNDSNELVSPGNSYSFNVNVGTKIAKRWLLQSGFNYLNYSSNTITNTYAVNRDKSLIPVISNLSSNDLSGVVEVKNTGNINLNSSLEFISIPIKAGYMLLNKKISIILLAGLSSDFFLKNTIKTDGDLYSDIVNTGGSDSPYNAVHFNGLMSTQVRYQFSENYSLTFEPSYAVALNSLTKTDHTTLLPNVFNLGLGLKYHFR